MCKGNESISFTFLPSGANEVHFRNSLKCSNSVKASSHFNTVFSAPKNHRQNVILHWKNPMVSGHIRFAKDFPAKHFRSPSLQGTSCSTFGSLLCINFFCQLARKIFPLLLLFLLDAILDEKDFERLLHVNFHILSRMNSWRMMRRVKRSDTSWFNYVPVSMSLEAEKKDASILLCATSKMQFLLSPLVAFCSS